MKQPTIHLWDIDGTLVSSGGAGRRAMERAFAVVLGAGMHAGFSFAGMTDRSIARTGIRNAGLSDDEAAIDHLLEVYLGILADSVPREMGYRVLPGVREALDATRGVEGLAVGLGTGNVRRGARIKLERVGLHAEFAFGGFGCDSEDRAELLRAGAERGATALGVPRAECRVIVIGDTTRDVDAARRAGAECLAVGTGGTPVEDLRGAGATWALADLASPAALAVLLDRVP